jgi:hypothetical protein
MRWLGNRVVKVGTRQPELEDILDGKKSGD